MIKIKHRSSRVETEHPSVMVIIIIALALICSALVIRQQESEIIVIDKNTGAVESCERIGEDLVCTPTDDEYPYFHRRQR